MSTLTPLTDYNYSGSSNQLDAYDACEATSNLLFIIGQESHYDGSFVEDNDYSVYSYNGITNDLTLIFDGLVTLIEGTSYGPDDQYSITFADDINEVYVGSMGGIPIVILEGWIRGDGNPVSAYYFDYQSSIIVNANTGAIIYESYANSDAYWWGESNGSGLWWNEIQGQIFRAYTVANTTYVLSSDERDNYPDALLYGTCGCLINSQDFVLGSPKRLYAKPEVPAVVGRVVADGVVYIEDPAPEVNYTGTTTKKITYQPKVSAPGDRWTDVQFIGGAPVFTRELLTYNWPSSVPTVDSVRTLGYLFGGDYYTEELEGIGFLNENRARGELTCDREMLFGGYFFKRGSGTDLKYLSVQERADGDIFVNWDDSSNCDDTEWNSYTLTYGYSCYLASYMYIANYHMAFTTVVTTYPSSTGVVCFGGPVGPILYPGISKYNATRSFHKAFLLNNRIFLLSDTYDQKLYYTEFEGHLAAEPKAITSTDEDDIFIGGMTHTPALYTDAGSVYTGTNGIDPDIVVSGYINTSLVIGDTMPSMPTSGLYYGNPVIRLFSVSGEALVKHYGGDDIIAYGNLLPYRALMMNQELFEDISGNLPTSLISSSLEVGDSIYICSISGAIYTLPTAGSGTDWTYWDSAPAGISTTLLPVLSGFFVATPAGEYSLYESLYLDSPVWERADYELPDGVTILDLEEEYYADR